MSSAFADAITAALGTVNDVAGDTVTYWRGTSWVSLKGVPGSTAFDTNDVNGQPVLFNSADWIFKVAELVINGAAITPRRGDLVKRVVGNKTFVYEVLTDGSQVFRYCDRDRTRVRVHTKEKSS